MPACCRICCCVSLVISEAMSTSWMRLFEADRFSSVEEIASESGRTDALLVHSGFEPQHLRALEASSRSATDDVIRLAYVGTIISEKGFLEMLSALDAVRPTLSKPVVLEFFGERGYARCPWFNPQWMLEHGMFSDEGLVASLQRCSWGIVVMDPEGTDLRYSRFSFPGKVGIYLSAGVPVLGSDLGGIAELVEHGVNGLLVPADSLESWQRVLQRFFDEPALLERLRAGVQQPRRMDVVAREMHALYSAALGPDRRGLVPLAVAEVLDASISLKEST